MSQKDHWEQIYAIKPTDKLGWYTPHLSTSLHWIEALGLERDAPIIDVGGGASTLVDDLLDAGYRSLTVLDLSDKALAAAQARLRDKAKRVTWLVGDVSSVELPRYHYALWHDRAVFHFLTAAEQRQKYRDTLTHALKPGGHLLIGTFAPDAPPKCSGLPVRRYSAEQLENALGEVFELQRHQKELHITPAGVEQMYLYCLFRKAAS